MPIRFQIRYDEDSYLFAFILVTPILSLLQLFHRIILRDTQKAIFTFRMPNITITSDDLYENIPFEDCLCSVVLTKPCLEDSLFKDVRIIPLLLFVCIVYLIIWSSLILTGDRIYIFVYVYWTVCIVCLFAILFIVYRSNHYYYKMSKVIGITSLILSILYALCAECKRCLRRSR